MFKESITKPYGDKIDGAEPVRCQKCRTPIGYITILGKGLLSMQQPIHNVKIIAICMDCARNKK